MRIRNFVFTLNNPEPSELEWWDRLASNQRFRDTNRVGYVVYQQEKGTNGTVHLQGYVEMRVQRTLITIKNTFGNRLHVEKRRGTQAQAIAYSQKNDTRMENGVSGEGGDAKKLGKDKLSVVAEHIKAGASIEELADDYPVSFIKYGAKIRSFSLQRLGPRKFAPEIHILYGDTGTGKSMYAAKRWPDAYWPPMPRTGGWWWPNYTGQKTVVFDEFANQWKYHTMLRLCDRYAFDVQEKGSNMHMVSKVLVFTTNIDPLQWYPGVPYETKAPLRRRFKDYATIYDFDEEDYTWSADSDPHFTVRDLSDI